VLDHGTSFLRYLSKNELSIGQKILVKDIQEFDKSMTLLIQGKNTSLHISHDVARNLLVLKDKNAKS
ncbi:MAG TPA: hypothetical protein PKJ62_08045, partial [Bacteroidia bacterium]|nr:hypothetical protein [Bacteroidia bacterium]